MAFPTLRSLHAPSRLREANEDTSQPTGDGGGNSQPANDRRLSAALDALTSATGEFAKAYNEFAKAGGKPRVDLKSMVHEYVDKVVNKFIQK